MIASPARRSGVILILASVIAVLIALLAFVLIGITRLSARQASAIAAAAQIRIAAASGMEYAASRLAAEGRPLVPRSVAERGDDWLHNPSYSHGEAWIEGGTPDGIYTPADARGQDRDGDGRFSAWSGRLRGLRDPQDLRFALRIDCTEGKIPLNAGHLGLPDGIDNDLDGSVDEADEADVDGMFGPNGVPDHRDPDVQYHASLAMALNNLGAIVEVATRRWDVPAGSGTEPIRASWIGIDLIRSRPVGGYRSWEQVIRTLTQTPSPFLNGPYTGLDLEKIRPYVDLGPYEVLPETGRCRINQPMNYPSYVPISFWVAPREVLESLWRYVETYSPVLRLGDPMTNFWTLTNDFPLQSPPISLLCPQSGLPYARGGAKAPVLAILWPAEAKALADEVLLLRQGSAPVSWKGLRERLSQRAAALFAADASALSAYPDFLRAWTLFKADLAFQAVAMDPYPYRGHYDPLFAWATWGIDADPSTGAMEHPPSAGSERLCRVMHPLACDHAVPARWPSGSTDPDLPYQSAWGTGATSIAPVIKPQGLTLAPPVRFAVESSGRLRSLEGAGFSIQGRLRAAERLELTSQEDFENLTGGPRWIRRGITPLDPSPAERHGCLGISDPRIVSLPRPNLHGRGGLVNTGNPSIPNVLKAPYLGYSRQYGALGLAPLAAGRQGAGLYFPIRDDFDGRLNAAAPPPAWMEHWSEWDAALYSSAAFDFLADPKPPYRLDSAAGLPTPDLRTYGLMPGTECAESTSPHKATTFEGVYYQPARLTIDVKNLAMPWYYRVQFQPQGLIDLASIEAWMGPMSSLTLEGADEINSRLILYSERSRRSSPDRAGNLYTVYVKWKSPVGGGFRTSQRSWFVADGVDPLRRVPGFRYAALALRRKTLGPKTVTECTLHVDGSTSSEDGAMQYDHEQDLGDGLGPMGAMTNSYKYNLKIGAVDEVRFRKEDGGSTAAGIHSLGRFVQQGTFQSPIYSLDGQGRLLDAQWTGVTPSGFVDGTDVPLNPFLVEVEGFSDAAGASSLGRRRIGATPADVKDLSCLYSQPLRAFRYWVTIDATGLAGVLDETPLFESIWIRLQRKGTAPAWAAWELR